MTNHLHKFANFNIRCKSLLKYIKFNILTYILMHFSPPMHKNVPTLRETKHNNNKNQNTLFKAWNSQCVFYTRNLHGFKLNFQFHLRISHFLLIVTFSLKFLQIYEHISHSNANINGHSLYTWGLYFPWFPVLVPKQASCRSVALRSLKLGWGTIVLSEWLE